MSFIESIQAAIEAIIANKMRSLLTMLGIIIGISSVITIVALGNGSQKMIQQEFEVFGVSRAFLSLNWRESPTVKDLITKEDADVLQTALGDRIKGISPQDNYPAKIHQKNEITNVNLIGINEQYNRIEKIDMQKGRFIMAEDVANGRFAAVIDHEFAKKLFNRTDVVGEDMIVSVYEQSIALTIVGVYEKPTPLFAQFDTNESPPAIYVPLSMMNMFSDEDDLYYSLAINMFPETDIQDTMAKAVSILERRHDAVGKNLFRTYTAESELAMVNQVMGILTAVIGAIAAISLLVGGIGIMNIMLVSVTERTREIGVRKAIGAKYSSIRTQFLIESMIISSLGGVIGIFLGGLFSFLIAYVLGFPPSVSISAVVIASLFSAGVGIFFGYYPASKAAKLDPIQALRYE